MRLTQCTWLCSKGAFGSVYKELMDGTEEVAVRAWHSKAIVISNPALIPVWQLTMGLS